MHIFSNVIVTFIFVSRIEYTLGPIKTAIIYFLSGISGNIFSALVNPNGIKAGASTSLYGMIGFMIGYLVINWNGVDGVGAMMKCQIYCTLFVIFLFVLFFTPATSSGIDYYGHLGGGLAGVWLSCIH